MEDKSGAPQPREFKYTEKEKNINTETLCNFFVWPFYLREIVWACCMMKNMSFDLLANQKLKRSKYFLKYKVFLVESYFTAVC